MASWTRAVADPVATPVVGTTVTGSALNYEWRKTNERESEEFEMWCALYVYCGMTVGACIGFLTAALFHSAHNNENGDTHGTQS